MWEVLLYQAICISDVAQLYIREGNPDGSGGNSSDRADDLEPSSGILNATVPP